MDNREAFRRLIETATNRQQRVLLCIAPVDGGKYIIRHFENTPNVKHAEENFCDDIEFKEQLKAATSIQLYITNTPCSLCAEKLRVFASEVYPVEVIIKCVHQYNLHVQANVDGLVRLDGERNVTLSVILEVDWRYLRDHFKVEQVDFVKMMTKTTNEKTREEVFGRLSGVDTNRREYRQNQLRSVINKK